MVRRITAGVYHISLAWSNAYLLLDDCEAALIDTGLPQDRARLRAALQQIGLPEARVHRLYLTHAHCDHAGNAAYFAGRSAQPGGGAARIALHREEARFLQLPRHTYVPPGLKKPARPITALAFAIGERRYPVERCDVDRLLKDNDVVDAPGGALRVVACPGHTPGHVAYFRERDGLLFSGDAIMNIIPVRRVPGLSLPLSLFTENRAQAIESARRLAELKPAALLAGHGRPLLEDTARRLAAWARTI